MAAKIAPDNTGGIISLSPPLDFSQGTPIIRSAESEFPVWLCLPEQVSGVVVPPGKLAGKLAVATPHFDS